MTNRDIEAFGEEAFYEEQYGMSTSDSHEEGQQPEMITYTTAAPMPIGGFDYPPPQTDLLDGDGSRAMIPSVSLGGHIPNDILPYETLPTTGGTISMGVDADNVFAYDTPGFPPSTLPVDRNLEHQVAQFPSVQTQTGMLGPTPVYSTGQPQESTAGMYWGLPQTTEEMRPSLQSLASRPSAFSQLPNPPQEQTLPHRQHSSVHPMSQSSSSSSVPPHRFIQPKRTLPTKTPSGPSNPEAVGESTPYTNIYSGSGFDLMRILAEVASRPDPKINIGAVDLSCAFVLCDITMDDHPIVYVSHAFERLTGYSEREIVGRNCRFLQGPNGAVEQGVPRKFVDTHTAHRLRLTIEERTEVQASIINYRKGGQPFMNLITMIPVRCDSSDYRFFVGFQVDLVEKPDAVMKRNPNGSFMINYQRSQLPSYVVPSPDANLDQPDPALQFRPEDVALIVDGIDAADLNLRSHLDDILVENSDDVIHVVSFDFEFLYLSPACRKVLEYKSSDLVGKTLSTVCHPSDIGPVMRDLRACTTNDPVSVIYRIRRKINGYTWFESRGSWYISERGRQFMVLVGREIPVYRLEQVNNVERGGLAENDVWAKLSMSGIILFITSKSRPVLGRAADDLIGKSIQDLVGTDSREGLQDALEASRAGQKTTFNHRLRHKKGHMLPTQTTFYPGDTKEGAKPTFLVAQFSFPKPQPSQSTNEEPNANDSLVDETATDNTAMATKYSDDNNLIQNPTNITHLTQPIELIIGSGQPPQISQPVSLFTELKPTRGSSWQFELRELEKQNRSLSDEVQRLLARRKKRKRKQNATQVEKTCALCQTQSTPEWRRGPSGNRDLCNSCGLRWAKQMRNAQAERQAA